jgi:hypothetical protein
MPTSHTQLPRSFLIFVALALTALNPAPHAVGAQGLGCIPDPDQTRIELGAPNAEGTTKHADLTDPSVSVGFHFTTTQPDAALLYVGDQWYDLNLYLYVRGVCKGTDGWEKLIRAWSVRAERRVIQFMRPNEQIVNLLPGEYLMVAQYRSPDDAALGDPFDPSKGFTARVATNSPYCALDPPDELQPNPAIPSVMMPRRPDDALYQLGLSIDPPESERAPFSLMSFGAFVSPPYTDLFDFAWVLDNQPVTADPSTTVYQVPTGDLPKASRGQHTIQVTATGARYYPDPGLTHLPPTLTVKCSFIVPG